jgi:hypothetical protein
MVKAIDAAIDRIRQLPETEQELLARFVLHEIEQDGAWRQTSEMHTESLARLVERLHCVGTAVCPESQAQARRHGTGQEGTSPGSRRVSYHETR